MKPKLTWKRHLEVRNECSRMHTRWVPRICKMHVILFTSICLRPNEWLHNERHVWRGEWTMQMNEIKCDYGWPTVLRWINTRIVERPRYDDDFMQMWQFKTCEVRRSWKQKQQQKLSPFIFIHILFLDALLSYFQIQCAQSLQKHMHFDVPDVRRMNEWPSFLIVIKMSGKKTWKRNLLKYERIHNTIENEVREKDK